MKFQFSIARLLAATTMVALTFGLARSMLGKDISSAAIFVAVLAADLGLLVLVAQKKKDVYCIFRILTFMLGCVFGFPVLVFLVNREPPADWIRIVLAVLCVASFALCFFFNMKIINAELKEVEDEQKREIQEQAEAEKKKEQMGNDKEV
jgi:hypothetical protein